jgi:hypothetical protein
VLCDSWKGTKTWDRSFVVSKYEKMCPQGIVVDGELKEGPSISFIEKKSMIRLRHKANLKVNTLAKLHSKSDKSDEESGGEDDDDESGSGDEEGEGGDAGGDPSKNAEADSKGEEEEEELARAYVFVVFVVHVV